MNKQELIEKYKGKLNIKLNLKLLHIYKKFIRDLMQLDEPQKVKVSEEEEKFLKTFDFNCENDVTKALYNVSRVGWGYYLTDNNGIELKDLTEGFRNLENRKRLIKAILDGYTVEEEKRYLVKMKGLEQNKSYLNFNFGGVWLFYTADDFAGYRAHHTLKELEEAGFGWVFDCEGIEIEEVEG